MLSIGTYASVFGILAVSTGTFIRLTGLISVAQAGMWAIGAYAGTIASNNGAGFWGAVLIAMIVALAVSLPVGVVALRSSGLAFLVVTLAISGLVVLVLENAKELTGGTSGLLVKDNSVGLVGIDLSDPLRRYYLHLGLLLLTVAILAAVVHSRFGRTLVAIRDNTALARSVGTAVLWRRLALFGLSSALVAPAGVMMAYQQSVVTPNNFDTFSFLEVFLMVILGGTGAVLGPLWGAWILLFMQPWLAGTQLSDPNYRTLIYGLLLILLVRLMPGGLGGAAISLKRRLRSRREPAVPQAAGEENRAAPTRKWVERPENRGDPLLIVDGLTKNFGGYRALDGVKLDVRQGEIHGLIGPNGSGKTTTLNCISGALQPDRGSVTLLGRSIDRLNLDFTARLGLIRTYQQAEVFASFTVAECLDFGSDAGERSGRPRLFTARELLELAHLERIAGKRVGSLPHGHRRLLGVAVAIAARPTVLLMDEPAAGLSAVELTALTELIMSIRSAGASVLIVEHDMKFLLPMCDWVTVLHNGVNLAGGRATEISENEQVIEAYLGSRR
ncbi:branched-chain amino acid ABC transporter ATP-binding protein/permease [Actinomadura macra]|uniref:branched-chain amino acid ABC transporter ATP-binding protein/permease n=1 Tax=Actinomadura macra TaxID=46164 RepID=UPI00248051B0|nr:ATP-binding cassette domain-containing protein [Actinomadura macra]